MAIDRSLKIYLAGHNGMVGSSIVKTLNRILKDCNVEVVKIISHQYASRFGDSSDTSPCVAGKRVTEGINSSEVITHSVHTKSQGLFEKMFNFLIDYLAAVDFLGDIWLLLGLLDSIHVAWATLTIF